MPPKRKGDAVTPPKPAKKAKTGGTPTRTSPRNKKSGSETPPSNSPVRKPRKPAHPGSKAVKAPDEDANFEWEILNGDERSTLVVGEAQPKRLTLTFHHRHDNNETDRTFKYDRRGEKEINWNNKDHIRDINKWRNQIFVQNMKFPPKVTHTPWTPFETAYLELFHEKLLEAATGKTDTFVAPHNELIFEAFNEYFEGRTDIRDKSNEVIEEALGTRPPGGLNSYLNRAGTNIRGLRDRMRAIEPKLKKSKKEDAWMPDIKDEEIEQYIKGEWEPATDTTAAVTADADDDEEQAEDEAQAEDEGEEDEQQAGEEDEGDDSDTSTLTTPPDTDEELESMEILEREQQAKRLIVKLKLKPSTASKFPGSKHRVTKPTTTKPTTTKPTTSNPASNTRSTSKATSGRSSAPSSSSPPPEKSTKKTSPAKKTMTDPRKTTEAPEPKSKPRVVKPVETPPIPTHPDVIADLKARGYTWTELPKNNEEAIKAHQEAQNKKPSQNTWVDGAVEALKDRTKRQTSPGFDHEFFNKDVQHEYENKGDMINVEDWHKKSARRDGAAAVTALLNAADIPPLGYTGDIRALHKNRLLSEDELKLADARDAAITQKHEAVERSRQLKIEEESAKSGSKKKMHEEAARKQKSVWDDPEITDDSGNESLDDPGDNLGNERFDDDEE